MFPHQPLSQDVKGQSLMTWESEYRVSQHHGYHSISIMGIAVSWAMQHRGYYSIMGITATGHRSIMSIAASWALHQHEHRSIMSIAA